jgi:hypothetical protein
VAESGVSKDHKADKSREAEARRPVPRPLAAEKLYQALSPHIKDLDQDGFTKIIDSISVELTKIAAPPESKPKAPTPADMRPWRHQDHSAPPELLEHEVPLEKRLGKTANPVYQGMPWHQRTKVFCFEWDQMRRRKLSALNTYFNSFQPRWEHADWIHFNLARRQADARGAAYQTWLSAQFENKVSSPQSMHGKHAVEAYLKKINASSPGFTRMDDELPFKPDLGPGPQPTQAKEDKGVLAELERLAPKVYGDDEQGLARLALKALQNGVLTSEELEERPRLKVQVYKLQNEDVKMGPTSKKSGIAAALNTKPKVII